MISSNPGYRLGCRRALCRPCRIKGHKDDGNDNNLADFVRTARSVYAPGRTAHGIADYDGIANVARKFLTEQGLADRSEVVAGDFFQAVRLGYDAYFIKSVLHDWGDEQCVCILDNIRQAMPAHGRILITEIVLEPGKPIGHPHRFIDMEMIVSLGGKERTAEEFDDLLRRTNMRMEQVHSIEGSFFSVVEGSMA